MALLEVMLLKVLDLAIPHLVSKAVEFLESGVDPETLTWEDLYGRSAEELRAEVDTRRRGRPRPPVEET